LFGKIFSHILFARPNKKHSESTHLFSSFWAKSKKIQLGRRENGLRVFLISNKKRLKMVNNVVHFSKD
jgi:hypothetical protein